ncbi:hypothetical protein B0H13DRAFT_2682221 [Mycena leptocephala]|nr:hypothetical protein B0H13DRAFT_2682221 [Mycena leptocephala]
MARLRLPRRRPGESKMVLGLRSRSSSCNLYFSGRVSRLVMDAGATSQYADAADGLRSKARLAYQACLTSMYGDRSPDTDVDGERGPSRWRLACASRAGHPSPAPSAEETVLSGPRRRYIAGRTATSYFSEISLFLIKLVAVICFEVHRLQQLAVGPFIEALRSGRAWRLRQHALRAAVSFTAPPPTQGSDDTAAQLSFSSAQ